METCTFQLCQYFFLHNIFSWLIWILLYACETKPIKLLGIVFVVPEAQKEKHTIAFFFQIVEFDEKGESTRNRRLPFRKVHRYNIVAILWIVDLFEIKRVSFIYLSFLRVLRLFSSVFFHYLEHFNSSICR